MFKLIKNGNIVSDEWKTLTLADGDTPQNVRLPVGPLLVPLSVWKARRAELIHREYEHGWPLGVWVAAEEDAEAIGRDIDDFTVIAVEFDKFADGKSYLTARTLREHYGFRGELRAIGDVPRTNVTYQYQVGFDSFAVRANQKVGSVLSGLFNLKAANQHHTQHTTLAG
ncbi:MAG: DUF934 domain-containing protein [Nitrosomonadales bacterium]|nr:DUF934 domain-containing protein [Nitrosomonadales bacterium]